MARPQQTSIPPTETRQPQRAKATRSAASRHGQRQGATADRSDVLVSAVISTYLLTHLHHVLQRAEYGAQQEGRQSLAANYAQLRKVLCLDARSMEDAFASGTEEEAQSNAA
ncbi:MAG: hypothetical protein WCL59_08885 [Cyanobium sp. ELA507]|jgi:hypothetical protein